MAGTKGHPHHPWSRAVGSTLVMAPTEDAGLSLQECQEGGQFGGGALPWDLEEQPGLKLDFLFGKKSLETVTQDDVEGKGSFAGSGCSEFRN